MLVWGMYGTFYDLNRTISCAAYTPTTTATVKGVGFDLYRSNSIYSGTTVKPKNLGILPLLKL